MSESTPAEDASWFSGRLTDLRHRLLSWWQEHGRHTIPWKLHPDGHPPVDGEGLDPYGVVVAEVMLQQTQLQVVLPYWQRWMAALPSLEALAAAGEHDVLLLWQGLGYYSRARRLQQGARQLIDAAAATAPTPVPTPVPPVTAFSIPMPAPVEPMEILRHILDLLR